jgi:hypothetical protein
MTDLLGAPMSALIESKTENLHGTHRLPDGYRIASVPPHASVGPLEPDSCCSISSSFNRLKTVIAIGQVLFAISTLYQSRGNQLSRFGYVAFGLTVTPYAVMSVWNGIAGLCCPQYTESYLVGSKILEEAQRRGGVFTGLVGILQENDSPYTIPETVSDFSIVGQSASFHQDQSGRLQLEMKYSDLKESQQTDEDQLGAAPTEISSEQDLARPKKIADAKIDGTNLGPIEIETGIRDNQLDPAKLNSSILLIPISNPVRVARASTCKQPILQGIKWSNSALEWNLDFKGDTRLLGTKLVPILVLSYFVSAIPFAIIGALSRYEKGESTYAQRVWIMAWLCIGGGHSLAVPILLMLLDSFRFCLPPFWLLVVKNIFRFFILGAAPIGGFVVAALMMTSYGSCTVLS